MEAGAGIFARDAVRSSLLPATAAPLFSLGRGWEALLGGVRAGEVLEVCGEAGSGKSTLACGWAVRSVLATQAQEAGCAMYINAEGGLPDFSAIAEGVLAEVGVGDAVQRAREARDATSAITVYRHSADTPLDTFLSLCELLEHLAEAPIPDLRLVVLDSVAAIARAEFEVGTRVETVDRSRQLFRCAALLKKVAHVQRCVVVVLNQAADVMAEAPPVSLGVSASGSVACLPRYLAAVSLGKWIRPALGFAWESCMLWRLMLTRPPREAEGGKRAAFVLTSPRAPCRYLQFEIRTGAGAVATGEGPWPMVGHR
jgi:hypothetical protein